MAQKITGYVKLQIPAGKATPAPPVGPALGQHGINIAAFTKEFNERTKNDAGLIIPVVITVYADRSFTFITKTPPAAVLMTACFPLFTPPICGASLPSIIICFIYGGNVFPKFQHFFTTGVSSSSVIISSRKLLAFSRKFMRSRGFFFLGL